MNKKKVIIEEFSQEKGDLESAPAASEIVSEELLLVPQNSGQAIKLAKGKLGIRKGGNIVIGTVNVIMRPIQKHFQDRHEKFYKVNKIHLAADIVFVLAILGLAAVFLFLFTFHPKAQIDLQTSLAEEGASSGQAETFTIRYKNNGKVDIKDSTLSLNFPKNFILQTVEPEKSWSDQTNTFQIGDLPRGANGQIKITGLPLGDINSRQTLVYSLNYSQDGQRGNALGSFVFPLKGSVLKTTFEAPKQIYQDVDFGGKIIIKNTGRADIEKEIDLIIDGSVVVLKSITSSKASLQNGAIIINGLRAGVEVEIGYEAVSGNSESLISPILSTYLNLNGKRSKQSEVRMNLQVLAMKFPVEIKADKEAIFPEEAVNFKLNFTNEENSDISNVLIDIVPADSATAIKSLVLKSDKTKYKVTGNSVVIGALKAGEKGEFEFEVVLSRQAVSVNQETGIVADINYQVEGRNMAYKIFSPKIKFISALQADSKGLYYSAQGDQLGVGPIPPVADVPTSYWIFWEINNFGNDLSGFTMTADLSANVGWTGRKTVLAGEVRYGEASRKVIWSLNDISAQKGIYRAGFEIQLIPTAADLGKIPALVSNIQYKVIDTFASRPITGSLSDINTGLKDDLAASGKGEVIQLKIVK